MSGRRLVAGVLAAIAGLVPLTCGGGGDDGVTACGTTDDGNHDLTHAAPFGVGGETTGCVGPDQRPDVYAFQLEDGAQAGYLTFQVQGDALGQPQATLFGADGDTAFATVTGDAGAAPMTFAVAVAPGIPYRLAIADDGSAAAPYSYQLSATFTPVPDAFEPNDGLEEAAPISLATPLEAYLFAGASPANSDLEAYDDYYRVALAGGQTVTVHLDDVPADLAPRLFIYDASGAELGRVVNGHKGEPLTLQLASVTAGGDHAVRVGLWTETPTTMSATGALPAHFTQPYRLTVTQP